MILAQISFSGKGLKQDAAFGLQHLQTKTWLSTNRQARFPNPIRNHAEVAGARNRQESCVSLRFSSGVSVLPAWPAARGAGEG